MAEEKLLKNWSLWVDGIRKKGMVKEYSPPALKIKTVDHIAGDMDMPVPCDDGMEPLEASFTIFGIDSVTLGHFGFNQGKNLPVSIRATYTDLKGKPVDVVEELGGMITTIERDAFGKDGHRDKGMKVSMKLDYYKVTQQGVVIVEIDPVNAVRKFGGIDVLEGIRAAMQII